jgi:hypothetical protein
MIVPAKSVEIARISLPQSALLPNRLGNFTQTLKRLA